MSNKNNDDDFPPTQAAPPPPPEPPPKPARPRRDPRAAAAPQTAEAFEAVEQMGPPSWKENPLIWIALVVAMFLAVPLLASMSTRGGTPAKRAPAAAAASAPVEDVAPAAEPIAPAHGDRGAGQHRAIAAGRVRQRRAAGDARSGHRPDAADGHQVL